MTPPEEKSGTGNSEHSSDWLNTTNYKMMFLEIFAAPRVLLIGDPGAWIVFKVGHLTIHVEDRARVLVGNFQDAWWDACEQ